MGHVRHGFTLFELLVVIGIISVLMTLTMGFGSRRLEQLQDQGDREVFMSTYSYYFSFPLVSNYWEKQRVSLFSLDFFSGGLRWMSGYVNSFVLSGFSLDGQSVSQVALQFVPYTIGCSLSAGDRTGNDFRFQFITSHKRISCFRVLPDTCKLLTEPCL